MGTDIHLATEVRVEGIWSYYPSMLRWDDEGFNYDNDPSCRQYSLFALLADVRNGFGFAGIVTHTPLEPLFPGRGLPEDRDTTTYNEADENAPWLGEHSFTWADFYELKEVNWDDTYIVTTGVVLAARAKLMKDGEQPEEYSTSVMGQGIETFKCLGEWEESGHPEDKSYIQCYWHHNPFKNCAFRRWVDGGLTEIADKFGPANVRVLMGFDS